VAISSALLPAAGAAACVGPPPSDAAFAGAPAPIEVEVVVAVLESCATAGNAAARAEGLTTATGFKTTGLESIVETPPISIALPSTLKLIFLESFIGARRPSFSRNP
jgi:hypothetical protein